MRNRNISDVAVLSEIGSRETMEDYFCSIINFTGSGGKIFGGVFDGHGGSNISKQLSFALENYVREELASGKNAKRALRSSFARAAKEEWAKKDHEGSCAATFFLEEETLTSANVGDCRIVIVGNSVRQVTMDHNANQISEVKRVQACGALITGTRTKYISYQCESLAPTRAIGDLHFKDVGVVATPFISQHKIKSTDRFIVAASDGLFGYVTNEEVLKISRGAKTALELVKALNAIALENLSDDNVTIIAVKIN